MPHEIRGVDVDKYAWLCQETSPKRWFENMEMTSNCDVTNCEHQIQMTTIWAWTKPPRENFLRTPLAQGNTEGPWGRQGALGVGNSYAIFIIFWCLFGHRWEVDIINKQRKEQDPSIPSSLPLVWLACFHLKLLSTTLPKIFKLT